MVEMLPELLPEQFYGCALQLSRTENYPECSGLFKRDGRGGIMEWGAGMQAATKPPLLAFRVLVGKMLADRGIAAPRKQGR
jgi:hypothetical protein